MIATRSFGLIAAAALVSGLAACQKPAAAVDTAKESAAIQAQVDAFNAAAKAHDAEKMTAMDAADFKGYGGGPDVTGRDEDLKASKAQVADPAYAFVVKPEHTDVAKSGDLALQTGTFDASGTNSATKAVEHISGHYVAGWKKDDQGTWRLAEVASAPGAAAPAAADKK